MPSLHSLTAPALAAAQAWWPPASQLLWGKLGQLWQHVCADNDKPSDVQFLASTATCMRCAGATANGQLPGAKWHPPLSAPHRKGLTGSAGSARSALLLSTEHSPETGSQLWHLQMKRMHLVSHSMQHWHVTRHDGSTLFASLLPCWLTALPQQPETAETEWKQHTWRIHAAKQVML